VTAALSDVLLVLLRDQQCDVHELQQRHERLFGPQDAVAYGRILATLTRLERLGYIRTDKTLANAARRRFALTPTGHAQQATWMRDLTPAADKDDFYVRGMLAVLTADPDEFDQLIASYLYAVEQRRPQARQRFSRRYSAEEARAAYDKAALRALKSWLRPLSSSERASDRAADPTRR
jgi:DNA-binding PadR family transcriptional regulator